MKRTALKPAPDQGDDKETALLARLREIAARHAVQIFPCDGWPRAGGTYSTDLARGLIHLDVSRRPAEQAWLLAHELGHHFTRSELRGSPERAETLADQFATTLLANLVSQEARDERFAAVDPQAAADLVPYEPSKPLSPNYTHQDFAPGRPCDFIRVSPALVAALEDISAKAGARAEVISGYRPPSFNREVGGRENSTHIDGLAADIFCEGVPLEVLHGICEDVIGTRGGVGVYPKAGFVHVDVRGYWARWEGK